MAETQRNQPEPKVLSAQPTLLTAEDLWKQPDDGYRYELVKGVIRRMPPAGFEHGIRSDNMAILKNIGLIILTAVCIILLIKYISDAPPSERKWWRRPWGF